MLPMLLFYLLPGIGWFCNIPFSSQPGNPKKSFLTGPGVIKGSLEVGP